VGDEKGEKKMGRLSVIIPDKLKQKLEGLKKEKETTAALLLRLIEAQEQLQVIQGLNLTETQKQEVKEAQSKSGFSFLEIALQGLLTRARTLTAFAEKLASTDLSDKSTQNRFFGVAAARIHQKVQELMQQAQQTISQKVLTKETHANLKAIKAYLLQHKAEIEA
jgi:hypothetical protein